MKTSGNGATPAPGMRFVFNGVSKVPYMSDSPRSRSPFETQCLLISAITKAASMQTSRLLHGSILALLRKLINCIISVPLVKWPEGKRYSSADKHRDGLQRHGWMTCTGSWTVCQYQIVGFHYAKPSDMNGSPAGSWSSSRLDYED